MSRKLALALAFALAVQPGCAFLLRGDTQPVEVSGTDLEVDGKPTRPGTVELRRRQVHVISARVKGRRETRVLESDLHAAWFAIDLVVFGVFLCPVGSITFLVDLATGSLNEFETTEVAFPVEKRASSSIDMNATACPQCATPFVEHAKFCAECGAKR
jgi:hypothetical protein